MYKVSEGAVCPQCEAGTLVPKMKDLAFNYKGRVTKFLKENVFKCTICDYQGLGREANERIDRALADFRRRVDGLLSCEELRSIRKILGLSKTQMARVLGVNEKTVGRYESGKVTQSESMDRFYRLLKAVPSEVKALCPEVRARIAPITFDYDPKVISPYENVRLRSADDYVSWEEALNAA